jgi:MarR family transcriptional regulator, temperature-dependent positive regulator of motility
MDSIRMVKYRGTAPHRALARDANRDAGKANFVPLIHRVPAHLARRFNQICVGAMAEIMDPEGILPREYAVLAAIDDLPGHDQRALATRLGIDAATAGQMIDRLESMGLVDRRVHPADRRSRVLKLTRSGTSLRQRLITPAKAAHERILAPLSAAERKLLVDFLVRIVEANESYARPGNGRRRPSRVSRPSDGGQR